MSKQIRTKQIRTIKSLLVSDTKKLEETRSYFADLLDYTVKYIAKSGTLHQFNLQKELYHKFNKNGYYTQHLFQIFKTASEMVRSCLSLCKSNCRTRFPKVHVETQLLVLFSNTFKIYSKEKKYLLNIAFKPRNPIISELKLTDRDRGILADALKREGRNVRDVKVLKREDRWFAYISIQEEVYIPKPEWCQTVVGVDVGMNYLVTASAITEDGKVHLPVHIKGKTWKHIQREKRAKLRKLQSNGAYTKHIWVKYKRRLDEQLHTASKRVIEYAKQFNKPVIVLEHLGKFTIKGRNRWWNFLLTNWQRKKLLDYIRFKANFAGIPVVEVSPYHTSQICSYCGSKGKRNGIHFKCTNCGKQFNADWNASVNIAKRFRDFPVMERTVERPSSFDGSDLSAPNIPTLDVPNDMKSVKIPEAEFSLKVGL